MIFFLYYPKKRISPTKNKTRYPIIILIIPTISPILSISFCFTNPVE